MRRPRALFQHAALLSAVITLCACNLDNPGQAPPRGDIYLPTGLLLSAQTSDSPPRYLYVVNSNFDLRYNAGSLQAYDLDKLDTAIGACQPQAPSCQIDPTKVLADEVLVPSLATSFGFLPDHSRLYVATRTETSLSFIDVDESANGAGVLSCDATNRVCSDAYQRGNNPSASPRRLTLPQEPVDLITLPVTSVSDTASSGSGYYIMLAHRAGMTSLFYDDGQHMGSSSQKISEWGPQLIDVLSNLALELTGITFDPTSGLAYASVYERGVTIPDYKLLQRVGISPDADPKAARLYDAAELNIDGVSWSNDTRALTLNPVMPGQLLVVSQDPAALLWVDIAGSLNGTLPANSAPALRTVDVGSGPSRVAVGELGGRQVAAVSCFDSHEVYVIEVKTGDVIAIVHGLNGPFELGIDSVRQRLYVADFRSSVVRVMDLSAAARAGASESTGVPVIATLGVPKVLQELQ